MVRELAPELRQDLILSLGTHRTERRLSPIEVAEVIDTVLSNGGTFSEIAELVRFDSTSTLREIHRLLAIFPDIQHLVGWGKPTPSTLPMKSASQVARLHSERDQVEAAKATLLHQLTSEEARQLVELKIRSERPMDECIEAILRLRPTIERKFLFVGAITSDEMSRYLSGLSQVERDAFLRTAITSRFDSWPKWSGKLGPSKFVLFGGGELATIVNSMPNGFEQAITACLETAVGRS